MSITTRVYLAILWLVKNNEPLYLRRILEVGGISEDMASQIANQLNRAFTFHQLTTEFAGVDINLSEMGLHERWEVPMKYVSGKSRRAEEPTSGYVEVDKNSFTKAMYELLCDIPTLELFVEWETIKTEGYYKKETSRSISSKFNNIHPMIVLDVIEHFYEPNDSLFDQYVKKVYEMCMGWQENLEKLKKYLKDSVVGKRGTYSIQSIDFLKIPKARNDLRYWLVAECVPALVEIFLRIDIEKDKWLLEVVGAETKSICGVECNKDLSDVEDVIVQFRKCLLG